MVIKILSGERKEAIFGYEISDKLSLLAEEYRSDNLPITFQNRLPDPFDVNSDPRLFVEQLLVLGLSATRIQQAIIDYYRAFEQRSSWARESLLISGEVEEYENKLVDEWTRYKEVSFEGIDDSSPPVRTTLNALVDFFQFTNRKNELRLTIIVGYFDHPSVIELVFAKLVHFCTVAHTSSPLFVNTGVPLATVLETRLP